MTNAKQQKSWPPGQEHVISQRIKHLTFSVSLVQILTYKMIFRQHTSKNSTVSKTVRNN